MTKNNKKYLENNIQNVRLYQKRVPWRRDSLDSYASKVSRTSIAHNTETIKHEANHSHKPLPSQQNTGLATRFIGSQASSFEVSLAQIDSKGSCPNVRFADPLPPSQLKAMTRKQMRRNSQLSTDYMLMAFMANQKADLVAHDGYASAPENNRYFKGPCANSIDGVLKGECESTVSLLEVNRRKQKKECDVFSPDVDNNVKVHVSQRSATTIRQKRRSSLSCIDNCNPSLILDPQMNVNHSMVVSRQLKATTRK